MSDFGFKDFMREKNKPQGNPIGELVNEFQRLRDEYKKRPSMATLVLLKAKQKKLAKNKIHIGI